MKEWIGVREAGGREIRLREEPQQPGAVQLVSPVFALNTNV